MISSTLPATTTANSHSSSSSNSDCSSLVDGGSMTPQLTINTSNMINFPATPPAVSTPTTSMMKDDFFDNIGTPNLLLFNTSLSSSDLMMHYSNPSSPIAFDTNTNNSSSLLKSEEITTTIPKNVITTTSTSTSTVTSPLTSISSPLTSMSSPPQPQPPSSSSALTSNNQITSSCSTMTNNNNNNNTVYNTPPGSSSSTPSLLSSPSTNFHYQSPQPSPLLATPLSPTTSTSTSLSSSTSSLTNISTSNQPQQQQQHPLLSKTNNSTSPVTVTTTTNPASTASFKTFSQAVNQLLPATTINSNSNSNSHSIAQQHLNKLYPHIKLQIVSEEFKFTVFVATTLKILELKQKISSEFNGLFGSSKIGNNPLSKSNLGTARLRDQLGNDLSYTKTVGDLLSDMDTVVVVQQSSSSEPSTIFNTIFPTTDSLSIVAKENSTSYNYSITNVSNNNNNNNNNNISNSSSNISSPSQIDLENNSKKLKLENNNIALSPPSTNNTVPTVSSPDTSPAAVVFSPPQQPHTPLSSNSTPIDPSSSSDSVGQKRPRSSLDNIPTNYFSMTGNAGQHIL
ncbi:hemagluttinin domain-containing protein [Heterostelium album PN500]|uniref:Hemagluttinin domain-containing protein n=1 Tax=Heterostelium pallidum (strain ATCC 26659 / Pp 5 / PN500) TaxID=670386 RepID=D3B1S1_HETP5|nr:hemagluttinin domain-containing protein [Heterostelium album PN500]EFA85245.1 hemagluttinin domain-containing protein [Heterostelium album PN500]|eukprot:XP_020437354.1 hemagluttinin domain-containing protein [Heterostelium album PN500]